MNTLIKYFAHPNCNAHITSHNKFMGWQITIVQQYGLFDKNWWVQIMKYCIMNPRSDNALNNLLTKFSLRIFLIQ